MQVTPNESFDALKEVLAQYLETQYRLSDVQLRSERSAMLREPGAIAQTPFVESTPTFRTSRRLAEVEESYSQLLPKGLTDLMSFGVPVNRNNLYVHQEKALVAAHSAFSPNLLVATGTGSGKTEAFLLPVLADILREASTWPSPKGRLADGVYDEQHATWLHSRRDETRPSGIRAIILYPMNALVNDQLSRLRRILSLGASPDWQLRNLNRNFIHFGMYTSATERAGTPDEKWRRTAVADYLLEVGQQWSKLPSKLRETGNWASPGTSEMLLRWDMQAAPPDILVTNYSMLEYMLVRPVESSMFDLTRDWLASTPGARFSLVLDEAHTYTGAKGTEVAHLIRRLKERLGVANKPSAFRAIATTASVPAGDDEKLKSFAGTLFGEDPTRFTLVRADPPHEPQNAAAPTESTLQMWVDFHDNFVLSNPVPAINDLAMKLGKPTVAPNESPQQAAYRLMIDNIDLGWIRYRTARNATPLDVVADQAWPDLETAEKRQKATAGLLSIGSFARREDTASSLPLLSMRLHSFFRGISGIWACMDPLCSHVKSEFATKPRPVGKLFFEPRPWCDCGSRVLELYTCHYCGLAYLAGIADSDGKSLWPWQDAIDDSPSVGASVHLFAVERPDLHSKAWSTPSYRSTRTTEICAQGHPHARLTWEIANSVGSENPGDPENCFPKQCPRCCQHRSPTGREVIENLQTKGFQSFAALLEEAFRQQPRSNTSSPNYGRKSLIFSDSRSQAAKLSQDLKDNHAYDLFRQILYRVLYQCDTCKGKGFAIIKGAVTFASPSGKSVPQTCGRCKGSGVSPHPTKKTYQELKTAVLSFQEVRGIDPTRQRVSRFFAKLSEFDPEATELAGRFFDVFLRREITDIQFALEPLGLARWRVPLLLNGAEHCIQSDAEAFPKLTAVESNTLFQSVIRLLAAMNIVIAPNPNRPWDWGKSPDGKDLLETYRRNVVVRGGHNQDLGFKGKAIGFSFREDYKLGRYIAALARKLVRLNRLVAGTEKQWCNEIFDSMWQVLKNFEVLTPAGPKVLRWGKPQNPYAIRLDRFELEPVGDTIHKCVACGYVMADPLLETCYRCGQDSASCAQQELGNYFRTTARFAAADSGRDDPFPLKVSEHTAQVASKEARDEERWFQDLFLDGQNEFDRRVDMLSVTTTMEMGIDIGSLLCVGLRNVPPTVANYQQRAGRAGRRGSALSSVITFASLRSHDAYYFERPPEIVTQPPRVPTIFLPNQIIARRHVRSMILQSFFAGRSGSTSNLFASWGTIAEFNNSGLLKEFVDFLQRNLNNLTNRASLVVAPELQQYVDFWLASLPEEIATFVTNASPEIQLLNGLIAEGHLPKYAFPIDVVSLAIPTPDSSYDREEGEAEVADVLQRDLKIAISEYAPGSEVVRQSDQVTWKYLSVGLNDPFNSAPDFRATDRVLECRVCKAVDLLGTADVAPETCAVCSERALRVREGIRPKGFTVDGAVRDAGRVIYDSAEGTERAGSASPIRLHVGVSAFSSAKHERQFDGRLLSDVSTGTLVVTNNGPEASGFVLCPTCGRQVNPDDPTPHSRPVDVPPHFGPNRGPRAGSKCPAKGPWTNDVVLVHPFHSEVLLLGVDLPHQLDAPFTTPAGSSIWTSCGTLIASAAVKLLQIDPGELRSGVRSIRRPDGRVHGEIFLYDDVPGGAGYARRLRENLPEAMKLALEMGEHCSNPNCSSACYQCILDYRNQGLHSRLDRPYGADMLRFILNAHEPEVDPLRLAKALDAVLEYAQGSYDIAPGYQTELGTVPCVLSRHGKNHALWPIHPMAARPSDATVAGILNASGLTDINLAVHNLFDMERRPFWVVQNLRTPKVTQL